jgi:hypothetical protein
MKRTQKSATWPSRARGTRRAIGAAGRPAARPIPILYTRAPTAAGPPRPTELARAQHAHPHNRSTPIGRSPRSQQRPRRRARRTPRLPRARAPRMHPAPAPQIGRIHRRQRAASHQPRRIFAARIAENCRELPRLGDHPRQRRRSPPRLVHKVKLRARGQHARVSQGPRLDLGTGDQ